MSVTYKSQNHTAHNQAVTKKRILVVDDHPIVRQGMRC